MVTRAMTISVVLTLLGAPCAASAQAIPGALADSSAALAIGQQVSRVLNHLPD